MSDSEDCCHVQLGVSAKSLVDCSNMYIKPEFSYQTLGTIQTYNCHFSLYVFHSRDLWYCEQCFTCNNCFGSVGLRNKEYCIFNKQYSPEEYLKTMKKIIQHMQKTGEWGQYFPAWFSPFTYNESVAQDYYPLTEKSAIEEGYTWHEKEESSHQSDWYTPLSIEQYDEKNVGYEKAMNNIQECLKGILKCSKTNKPFKIISQELVYYIEHHIPLPDICPDARYLERSKLRNAHQLYERQCAKTGEKLISTYAPDRPEIIYGEKAFQDLMV